MPRPEDVRAMLDLLPMPATAVDREGITLAWNAAAARLTGWSSEEVVGRVAPFVRDEPAVYFQKLVDATFEDDGPLPDMTMRRYCKDGAAMDVLLSRTSVRDESGAVFAMLAQFVDVTAARVAASERERFDGQLIDLYERTGEALLLYGEGGRIVYVNPRLLALLGYQRAEELVGQPALSLAHPDEVEQIRARIERITRDAQTTAPLRQKLLRKDGSAVVVEAWGLATMFRGRPAGLTHFRDLTETLELEARVHAADRMATIGRLAAVIGHEINNPLAYVLGNLEALGGAIRRGADPAALGALLDAAVDGAARVRRIVADLRVFSRADDEERVPVDLGRVLDSCARMASNEIRHRARLIHDSTEAVPVLASEARLGQVFLNLLVNAAQAIPEGDAARHAVTIRTRVVDDMVQVEVIDTGAGIEPSLLQRIFGPFVTTKDEGTGLGLSICRSLVEGMAGTIAIESEVGRGTTVRVRLPRASVPVAAARAEVGPPPSTRRRRILVVDDEPRLAGVIGLLLGDHDTTIAHGGNEALARIEREPQFDVVLCDLMMPDLSGMALHDRLRAKHPGLERRMVFMTGGAFTPQATEFLARVPNVRIEKPFDAATLLAAVESALR